MRETGLEPFAVRRRRAPSSAAIRAPGLQSIPVVPTPCALCIASHLPITGRGLIPPPGSQCYLTGLGFRRGGDTSCHVACSCPRSQGPLPELCACVLLRARWWWWVLHCYLVGDSWYGTYIQQACHTTTPLLFRLSLPLPSPSPSSCHSETASAFPFFLSETRRGVCVCAAFVPSGTLNLKKLSSPNPSYSLIFLHPPVASLLFNRRRLGRVGR